MFDCDFFVELEVILLLIFGEEEDNFDVFLYLPLHVCVLIWNLLLSCCNDWFTSVKGKPMLLGNTYNVVICILELMFEKAIPFQDGEFYDPTTFTMYFNKPIDWAIFLLI